MKAKSLFCFLVTSALLLCCNCVSCKKPFKSNSSCIVEKNLNVQVDDTVRHLLGDSVSKIIFEADSVTVLSLSVKQPRANECKIDTIGLDSVVSPDFHGCFIKNNYGVITKSELCPMLLVLSDRENYFTDSIRLKSPFIPNVALSFVKGNAVVDMIFSFSGGQMYVFLANEDKIYFKYSYERLILKFFQNYLKDERIEQYLNL